MSPAAQRKAKADKAAAAQRRAAEPQSSIWVAASAGTGKTKVLTDRVLSLMLHGTQPARILCLTFTKAAAAEMANRVAERLAGWTATSDAKLAEELEQLIGQAPGQELIGNARQLFARVLDAPGGLKIKTIHAFCQSLLGRFPLEARVPPHFQVLDERSAEKMLQAAREEVLAAAHRPGGEELAQAVAVITAHAHEQSFHELMTALIGERARVLRLIRDHQGVEGLVAGLCRALGIGVGETATTVLAEATADAAFDSKGLKLATAAMAQGSKTDRSHGAAIEAWLTASPQGRTASFQDYLAAFFTEGGQGDSYKTLIYKDALAARPGADEILADEAERLEAVRDRLHGIAVSQASAAMLRLGAAVLEAYKRHKRARGLLDYDDLILETRDLLTREGVAAWVLYKLDGGVDHVLIDEAQDTNPEQWQVIKALTAEFFAGEGARETLRTVFAVGDAKQSIFSFQRADPHAFAEMSEYFATKAQAARQGWDKVDLDVSFRSTAAVLQAIDRVFASPEVHDGVLFGESGLSHDSVRVGQAGLVELWPAADPREAEDPAEWEPPRARSSIAPARARRAGLIDRRIWLWTGVSADAGDPEAWLASK